VAVISMGVILVTVVVQGALAPKEARGSLDSVNLLVINDGIFQAIGVISFGKCFLPTIYHYYLVFFIWKEY
jgi:solute carrier family 38 (sodium-coupled neutral amino acid transporter), member 11